MSESDAVDLEIEAIAKVATALKDLDEPTRGRVLRWASERYAVTIDRDARIGNDQREPEPNAAPKTSESDTQSGDDAAVYEHFAEFFDATGATTEPHRLLVAGYWIQKLEGASSFGSLALNNLLKDLGRQVTHTSERMDTLVKAKPALVWQLKKSGSTKQARKSYKLTHEGIKLVEQMIRNGSGSS